VSSAATGLRLVLEATTKKVLNSMLVLLLVLLLVPASLSSPVLGL